MNKLKIILFALPIMTIKTAEISEKEMAALSIDTLIEKPFESKEAVADVMSMLALQRKKEMILNQIKLVQEKIRKLKDEYESDSATYELSPKDVKALFAQYILANEDAKENLKTRLERQIWKGISSYYGKQADPEFKDEIIENIIDQLNNHLQYSSERQKLVHELKLLIEQRNKIDSAFNKTK